MQALEKWDKISKPWFTFDLPPKLNGSMHIQYGNLTLGNIGVSENKEYKWMHDTPHRGWSLDLTNITVWANRSFSPRYAQATFGSAL